MATINQVLVNNVLYDIEVDATNVVGKVANAAAADKIGEIDAGSVNQPIYLQAGMPVAMNYTIEKSVPSDAVFTDTTYEAANETNFGLVKLSDDFETVAGGANEGVGASAKAVVDSYNKLKSGIVELTQAEYNALGDEKLNNDVVYYITDAGGSGEGGVSVSDVTVLLSLENWVAEEDGDYSQTVTIDGLSEGSNPIVMLSYTGDEASDDELYSYACIKDISVSTNTIKFTCSEMPKVSFTVIVKSVVASGSTGASANDVVIPVLDTGWTLDETTGLYIQTLEVKGFSSEATPIVGLVPTATPTPEDEADAYSHIVAAETGDGTLTLYADEAPSIAITILAKGGGVTTGSPVADITNMVSAYNELKSELEDVITIKDSGSLIATTSVSPMESVYHVKNGICYLTAEFTLVDGLGQNAILFTGLPKPSSTWYCSGSCNNGYAINLAIGVDGSLSKYYSSITGSQRVDMSVAYPIAE